MTRGATRLASVFNGSSIEVDCEGASLADELRLRLGHLLAVDPAVEPAILQITLEEIEHDWIEIRDSTGRCERGHLEHILYYARRWMIEGFVEAHPGLLWLHAGAAARDGAVALFSGPPGVGKSTLAVRMLDLGWTFVADDVVAVDMTSGLVLPLPSTPCIRTESPQDGADPNAFLEQCKRVVPLSSEQVARSAQPVGAIIFPEYSPADALALSPLSTAAAAQRLLTQCLRFNDDKARTVGDVFRFAKSAPAFHLKYCDPAATAAALGAGWPEISSGLNPPAARRPAPS